MGRGDRKNRKSIGVDLAPAPRKKKRGGARQRELDAKLFRIKPGRACVYAIEARGTEFIKIGVARNPYSRLKDLQTGSPNELALLYAIETDENLAFKVETLIHSLPETINSRGEGEWVDISPKIVPALFSFSADAVGADLKWRFGAPSDEEPEDFDPRRDPLVSAASGHWAGRGKRSA